MMKPYCHSAGGIEGSLLARQVPGPPSHFFLRPANMACRTGSGAAMQKPASCGSGLSCLSPQLLRMDFFNSSQILHHFQEFENGAAIIAPMFSGTASIFLPA
jgi:hypothetical protein